MRAFFILISAIITLSSGFAYAQESKDPLPQVATQSGMGDTDAASVESLTAKDAVASALDIFEARDSLAEYVDRYASDTMDIITWIMGIFGTLVTLVLIVGGFLLRRVLEESRAAVESLTEQKVYKMLKEQGEAKETFVGLVSYLQQSVAEYDAVKASVAGNSIFSKQTEGFEDPSYAYDRAKELTAEYSTIKGKAPKQEADTKRAVSIRFEAAKLLDVVLKSALKGEVDPNTVFNSAATAGKFDFDDLALKLQTMAYQLSPTPSHQLAMLDNEHNLGRGYVLEKGDLKDKGLEPKQARKAAFAAALKTVEIGARPQSEIILSRSWNMAERGREDGAYDALIVSVQKGIDAADKGTLAASYYYVTLFLLLARRANADWKNEALAAAQKAVDALAQESPLATWYESSMRELASFSGQSGLMAEVKAMFEAKGLKFGGADQSQAAAQMMQMIARLQGRESKGKPSDDDNVDA